MLLLQLVPRYLTVPTNPPHLLSSPLDCESHMVSTILILVLSSSISAIAGARWAIKCVPLKLQAIIF